MRCLTPEQLDAFTRGKLADASDVQAHLSRCDDCRELAAALMRDHPSADPYGPTLTPATTPDAATSRESTTIDQGLPRASGPVRGGMMLGDFEVIERLGAGGMSEVFLARDARLGRRVAIKLLGTRGRSAPTPAQIERFAFEARATARLGHPNIVTLFDVGQHEGTPYVVLEYVEGRDLRKLLDGPPLALPEALRIALGVAEALREAHKHRVLHRDLKPANVVLGRDGRARVLDFGLARLLDQTTRDEDDEADHDVGDAEPTTGMRPMDTHTGAGLRGTPAYMAPEQWAQTKVSAATDIWAFGLLLHELLSGEHPWRGRGLSSAEIAETVTDDEPVLIATSIATQREPLRQLLTRCLDKRVEARPSADEACRTLRQLLYPAAVLADDEGPFRGLSVFREENAAVFFGRDREINQALERLEHAAMLPVVGPSGAGKSSFVRAGLIPRLREQGRWNVLEMRPGRRPFHALAEALLAGAPSQQRGAPQRDELARQLAERPGEVGARLRQLARDSGARVLLFIDQLEEVLTHLDKERAQRFTMAVLRAADEPREAVRVVFTMREDFLGQLAVVDEVWPALERLMVIGPPTRRELARTIDEPLRVVGYALQDERLADEMLDAVADEPACLPLLQFILQKLWERRDARRMQLTRADYEALGGVRGALARHADGVLDELAPQQLELARALLLRLSHADGTRRVCERSQLLSELPGGARQVFDRLVERRLVLVRRAREGADAEVELVHEWLIRSWSRLARWIDESRADIAVLAEALSAARAWQRRDASDEALWRGDALADARRALDHQVGTATELVRRFIETSTTFERRGTRRRRALIAGAIVLLSLTTVGAVGAALTISAAQRQAQRSARAAKAEAKRAQAAERRVSAQIHKLRREQAARRAAVAREAKARTQVVEGKKMLELSHAQLRQALRQARTAESEAKRLARARRATNERLQKLLATQRKRLRELEARRAKIGTTLR